MKNLIRFLVLILSIFTFLQITNKTNANQLVIDTTGGVFLVDNNENYIDLEKILIKKSYEQSDSYVLGSSSGVSITVTVSQFAPTDTPTPTNTPAPTNTPTPTPTSIPGSPTSTPTLTPTPTNTPSPTNSPTPTSILSGVGNLIVTAANGSSSVTQTVDQLTLENGNSTVTLTSDNGKLKINQDGTEVTTDLPVNINSDDKKLSVLIKGVKRNILLPREAIEIIKNAGTYIIPETITVELVEKDKKPVYIVRGKEWLRIFNKFDFRFNMSIDMSATDGKILKTNESIFLKILTFLRLAQRVIK